MPDAVLEIIRACQRQVPCQLAGGAALAGAYLGHRRSNDIDLFCHELDACRALVRGFSRVAEESSASIVVVRDAGAFVRARVTAAGGEQLELDVVHEPSPDLEPPPPPVEGIVVSSFADLRAAKLTCILSHSEPRDLVDVLFLERAGFAPEKDLALAAQKDRGIDPGVIAWLLGQFPVEPLPMMLEPLSIAELRAYRDDLAERFRQISVPPDE